MALLDILYFPDPRLRLNAKPVEKVDSNIQRIVADMFETMYAAPGIGLAAPQVNIQKRIVVLDTSEDRSQPLCLINPVIVRQAGHFCVAEGCLSLPDIFEEVDRPQQITVTALNLHGQAFTMEAADLLAICIQHETDHLEGKLFVDYLSALKQQRIRKKFVKAKKLAL